MERNLLGRKVKDKITGFEGTVTAYCRYLTGCNQALVQPPLDKDGKHVDSLWIDEQRLDFVDDSVVTLDNGTTPGADKAAPKR